PPGARAGVAPEARHLPALGAGCARYAARYARRLARVDAARQEPPDHPGRRGLEAGPPDAALRVPGGRGAPRPLAPRAEAPEVPRSDLLPLRVRLRRLPLRPRDHPRRRGARRDPPVAA